MNAKMLGGAASAATLLTLWACQAPPVPRAGQSELWDQVHGKKKPAAQEPPVASPQEAPKQWKGELVFSETEKDLGDVKRGDQASHKFTITNKTDQVLHIKNVRGS